MNIQAYTSVTSEKTKANPAREFLVKIGVKGYLDMARTFAQEYKAKMEAMLNMPLAGMTREEIKAWLEVKNPSPKVDLGYKE